MKRRSFLKKLSAGVAAIATAAVVCRAAKPLEVYHYTENGFEFFEDPDPPHYKLVPNPDWVKADREVWIAFHPLVYKKLP